MPQTINTNLSSLNAQRNVASSQSTLQTTMQRLSSGLRVNSAKDDAAGLAIAERMNAQVRGMNVAIRNANDGVSLAQTAEGAIGKIGDALQRMRELAVQSANGTNNSGDRDNLQTEFSQLRAEITRLVSGTSFNGQNILDGSNPTILYAYGGFNASMTPNYDADVGKLWLEEGGVYVLANIRGGGEFGPAWHEAGLKTHRQTIYDDFAAVAQDLIARKVTSPRRLGIQGGSNGGLLMGVQFTQRPDLWNAVDIQVPLLDMLRFEQIQAGASWVGEYGSVSVPAERAFLTSISPYNNLKSGMKYPTPLIWTTTKDDRVGPQHARKFAAKMASMGLPYYFFEVIEGGHGSGANIAQQVHTTALEFTYFARQLMDSDRKPVP